jgi:hypothetical protein
MKTFFGLLIASTLASPAALFKPVESVPWEKELGVTLQVPASKRDLMMLDFYHTLDKMQEKEGKPIQFTTELIAANAGREKSYKCNGHALKKCLHIAGATGAAICGLTVIKTLGFSCAAAIIGSGLGAAGCVYSNCDYK